ncbi:MAG: hypothetical protein ACLFQA_00290 [Bacteroidales bacterium]
MKTKTEIAEIITRQFDLTEDTRLKVIYVISRFNDKKFMAEARQAGLELYRIRDGQFIINTKLT